VHQQRGTTIRAHAHALGVAGHDGEARRALRAARRRSTCRQAAWRRGPTNSRAARGFRSAVLTSQTRHSNAVARQAAPTDGAGLSKCGSTHPARGHTTVMSATARSHPWKAFRVPRIAHVAAFPAACTPRPHHVSFFTENVCV
jgi:hypothetical protein